MKFMYRTNMAKIYEYLNRLTSRNHYYIRFTLILKASSTFLNCHFERMKSSFDRSLSVQFGMLTGQAAGQRLRWNPACLTSCTSLWHTFSSYVSCEMMNIIDPQSKLVNLYVIEMGQCLEFILGQTYLI